MNKISVVLADDHKLLREGLVRILETAPEISVVGQASDGLATLKMVAELQPDVLLLDISMPKLSGLEVARRVKKESPGTKVVVLSMHEEEEYFLRIIRAGASGYLLKDAAAAELIEAVRCTHKGKAFFSPEVSKVLAESYREVAPGKEDPFDRLNDREREVLQLVAEGNTNKQIADLLFISPKTVDNHRTNLMRKLGTHSSVELVLWATKKGLVG